MSHPYSQHKKFHYTYCITELNSSRKYIGVRSSDVDPLMDIGVNYFSSSSNKEFIDNQKYNHNNYEYNVLNIFDTRPDATSDEIRLHVLHKVDISNEYINVVISNSNGFNPVDYITVKDSNNNIYSVKRDDHRYLSGMLKGICYGKVTVKDKDGNTSQVDINDPRYLIGELIPTVKNMLFVQDKNGKNYQVKKDDTRFLSRELVGINKDKVVVIDKEGNKFKANKDDPRFLTGEIVGHSKGYCMYQDINGNRVYTNKNDTRVKSGELFGLHKGMVNAKDQHGNIFKINVMDPRYVSGELVNQSVKFKVSINGKIYPSIKFACLDLGMGLNAIRNRINNKKYTDWFNIPF